MRRSVFLNQLQLSGGHAFSYSARRGTPAAEFKDQVHGTERHGRSNQLRDLFTQTGRSYREKWVGKFVEVLWESSKTGRFAMDSQRLDKGIYSGRGNQPDEGME